ncbi:hypothetical protein BKA58DRAFT_374540 [Alternaria rosae]|uniref:uncharacterized protein n=1 Tax=Alternaria rosae TaxID=1187941 RepID=UPI001E8E5DE4|nr:uncharacterized protein BKA58DRAFT_374540 [Alternaria rosae]KAH6883140.1 hypothetical protein BKA58DRAFT_374540 [Alternaria rosae]
MAFLLLFVFLSRNRGLSRVLPLRCQHFLFVFEGTLIQHRILNQPRATFPFPGRMFSLAGCGDHGLVLSTSYILSNQHSAIALTKLCNGTSTCRSEESLSPAGSC